MDLQKLEKEIDTYIKLGHKLWLKIAEKLRTIRDKELWKPDHKSFKAYVHDRWGKGESWCYRLMQGEAVVQQLTDAGLAHGQATTMSERAARALMQVSEVNRVEVAKEA